MVRSKTNPNGCLRYSLVVIYVVVQLGLQSQHFIRHLSHSLPGQLNISTLPLSSFALQARAAGTHISHLLLLWRLGRPRPRHHLGDGTDEPSRHVSVGSERRARRLFPGCGQSSPPSARFRTERGQRTERISVVCVRGIHSASCLDGARASGGVSRVLRRPTEPVWGCAG